MSQSAAYSTAEIAARDRFAYWREAVCASYVQLGCEVEKTVGFTGDLHIVRYSGLSVSEVSGAAHKVVRRPSDIRATAEADFLVSLQRRNTSRLTQHGRDAVLEPGDLAIYDSTQPYSLELGPGFTQTVLQFPKKRLLERLPAAEVLGGTRIDGTTAIGRLVRETALGLSAQLETGNPVLSVLLQETLIDLIATGLADGTGAGLELSSPDRQALLRARAFIADHLSDPDLDRGRVALSTGLSVRRLNDLFHAEGTSISAAIRGSRIEAAARRLRDPRFEHLSVSEIAMRCGFNNLQHFSTLFRKTYGCSPRVFRADPKLSA